MYTNAPGEIETILKRRRAELLREATGRETALRAMADERASELEECAQGEQLDRVLTRLDDRERQEITEIDAALDRIAAGTYGRCGRCEEEIDAGRLLALPETELCVSCATEVERTTGRRAWAAPKSGVVPSELEDFGDGEMASVLRDAVRADSRIDDEELTISCRHGVVYLEGALPSHVERVLLRRLVQDVVGFRDVVERLRIDPTPWQRADRSKAGPHARPRGFETLGSGDVVESAEEGVTFIPPDRPPPEEEP